MSEHEEDLDGLASHLGAGHDDGEHDDDDAPLPQREMPGFLRFMPELIKEIHNQGADVTMSPSGDLLIDGFYTNGPMKLVISDNQRFIAVDKRGQETPITCYEDLARLNFTWWQIANKGSGKRDKYVAPLRPWLDYFKKAKLVKRAVFYVEVDDNDQS